jgi:hypothetical protein
LMLPDEARMKRVMGLRKKPAFAQKWRGRRSGKCDERMATSRMVLLWLEQTMSGVEVEGNEWRGEMWIEEKKKGREMSEIVRMTVHMMPKVGMSLWTEEVAEARGLLGGAEAWGIDDMMWALQATRAGISVFGSAASCDGGGEKDAMQAFKGPRTQTALIQTAAGVAQILRPNTHSPQLPLTP